MATHFLDFIVLGVSLVVGGMVIWLHFKLQSFVDREKSLVTLSEALNTSIDKAYNGVSKLEASAQGSGMELSDKVDEANKLIHELKFVISNAKSLSDKLSNEQGNTAISAVVDITAKEGVSEIKYDSSPKMAVNPSIAAYNQNSGQTESETEYSLRTSLEGRI